MPLAARPSLFRYTSDMFMLLFALFYAAAYVFLAYLCTSFFGAGRPRFGMDALRSILLLSFAIVAVFVVVAFMPDAELANRLQHGVGGGVLGVILCLLVCNDQRVRISRPKFIVWSALIVTALGVGNELLEFFVQTHTRFIFAENALDTWRDLASNSVGIALAAPLASLFRR